MTFWQFFGNFLAIFWQFFGILLPFWPLLWPFVQAFSVLVLFSMIRHSCRLYNTCNWRSTKKNNLLEQYYGSQQKHNFHYKRWVAKFGLLTSIWASSACIVKLWGSEASPSATPSLKSSLANSYTMNHRIWMPNKAFFKNISNFLANWADQQNKFWAFRHFGIIQWFF